MVVVSGALAFACATDMGLEPPSNGAGGAGGMGGVGGEGAIPENAGGGNVGLGAGGFVTMAGGGTPTAAGGFVAVGESGGAAGFVGGSGGVLGSGGSGASGAPGTGGTGPIGNANCGMRSGQRGKTSRTIPVGGMQRSFIAYLPPSASPSTPVPLVYVFHGANQNGAGLYDATEYSKIADSEGIAVVFPDGQGTSSATGASSLTPWSVTDGPGLCGLGTLVSNPNPVDFAFVDAIKVEMKQDQCIDDEHVYATGFSMGGYMSHHIACDRSDFRAAGPHSGGTMGSLGTCKTGHMPIIIFHGDADPLINDACDDPKGTPEPGYSPSATLWAAKNGCQATYQTIPVSGANGMNGQCYLYDGCPADGQVEACIFTGLAHAWSGAPVCASCIGSGAGYPSATQIEWQFFKKYAW
ncbi:MAG TPA: PHB depolymerase family esterase [Polyangiaceae bacterium]|nr:PHB depolymerase family esterase [Polyangiaceae bacterium]